MKARSLAYGTLAQTISEFASRTTITSISPEVRQAAKLHLLDGLATMLGGATEESSRLLRRRLVGRGCTPEATPLGCPVRCAAENAALINGVQGHVLDYDDAQLATLPSRPLGQQTHPTAPVLAAALALAEAERLSGSALLTSYITGVEVACRLGDAVDPIHYLAGFHPTGTLGTFGAAIACGKLLKLKPQSIRHALGIAGTFAAGLRANRGTMAKGLNAGRAAQNGLIAARLAADGFTASENIFNDPMGFFSAACRGHVDARLLRFGKPFFFIEPGIAIKLYPCAGVLHAALDLALDLRAKHSIEPKQILRIRIGLNAHAALPLVYRNPKDTLEAKFSPNFAVAAALLEGAAGLRQFTAERLGDKRIQSLMKRIGLRRRSGTDTEIEITLSSGAVYCGRKRVAHGHPSVPASRAEIEEKFHQCSARILPSKTAAQFLQTVWMLERVPSVAAWVRALRPMRR